MTDVLVVGAGPSGLTLAGELAGVGHVLVVDRDDEPGGVPRHSHHLGYGIRDLRTVVTGPEYARRLADTAASAGATLRTQATVTGVRRESDGLAVDITSPLGREVITTRALVLATGCRERPRSARLVPGDRPAGVLTTGWLQRLVHLDHRSPGTRAVVVGAEHVSYSAVVTLADAGCRTVAMVTDKPRHTSYAAFDAAARLRYRFPLLTRTRVTRIIGHDRVTGVEVVDERTGEQHVIECDTVVFTGDWIAEHELARRLGLAMDPATSGPVVDGAFRTSVPGVFAVGNLLHPASTADRCALDGRAASRAVADWLSSAPAGWPTASVPVLVDPPLAWASPAVVTPGTAPHTVLLQVTRPMTLPTVTVTQGARTLWSGRVPIAVPTRPFPIPGRWHADVTGGDEVRIGIA